METSKEVWVRGCDCFEHPVDAEMKCGRNRENETVVDFCICGEDLCNKDMGPLPTVTTT